MFFFLLLFRIRDVWPCQVAHGLTCVAQRGTDVEWPDDHSPVVQDPYRGKKGENTVFVPFFCLFFFFIIIIVVSFCMQGTKTHKKRSVTRRCLSMYVSSCSESDPIQFNLIQFNSAHPDSFSAVWSARGHLSGYADPVLFYRSLDKSLERKKERKKKKPRGSDRLGSPSNSSITT